MIGLAGTGEFDLLLKLRQAYIERDYVLALTYQGRAANNAGRRYCSSYDR